MCGVLHRTLAIFKGKEKRQSMIRKYYVNGKLVREFSSLQEFYHRERISDKPKTEKKRVEFHFIKPIEY
jgi:hypothetical protein